jgi:hypothetical protein
MAIRGNRFVERCAPFREATLLGRVVRAFVGNVVYEAHESVERREPVATQFRQ